MNLSRWLRLLSRRRSKSRERLRMNTTSVTTARPSTFWSTIGIRMPLCHTFSGRLRNSLNGLPPLRLWPALLCTAFQGQRLARYWAASEQIT
jgi:hypothetical protein